MDYKTIAIFSVIGLSLLGVIGDYFLKLASSGERYINFNWFVVGLIIYSSTAIGWFFAMKYLKLGVLGMIYGISTVIFLTLVGLFFFKEQLTYSEMAGLGLGLISLILLSKFA